MITLDRRSGSFELLPHFPKGSAKLGHLAYGDASWLGNGPDGPTFVGFERKAIHDLLNSVDTGRLQGHQIPGLLSSYSYTYLCVEGLWRVGRDGILEVWWSDRSKRGKRSGFSPLKHGSRTYMASSIHNLLNTLMMKCGIMVYRTDNSTHTSSLILDLYRWWQKPWDSHRGHKGFSSTPHPVDLRVRKPGLVQCVAKELPGLGWERSKAVAEHFDTVLSMVLANEEDWRQIEGVGKVTAEKVVKSIRGQ